MTDTPIDALAADLIAAQQELSAPTKNRTVKVKSEKGSYSFDYATLDGIVEGLLRPILPKHGIWFAQFAANGQMVTRILHKSGQYLDCGVPMPNIPAKPQDAGSLITYFKRYSLCAAFALVAEEDDAGNAAQGNHYEAAPRQARQPRQSVSEQLSDGYRTESAKMLHAEMLKPQTPEKLKEWRKTNADMLKQLDEHDGKIMFDSYQQRLGHLTAAVARA